MAAERVRPVALSLRDLSWSYENGLVLRGLNLDLPAGGMTGIVGPNGSGKTTLLKLILRLMETPRGAVMLEDRDIRTLGRKELARAEAYVPQESDSVFSYTAAQIVEMGRECRRGRWEGESAEDRAIVREAMEATGVERFRNKPLSHLSGGEAQRVVLARALAQQPRFLLLDEPTNHLDLHHRIGMLELIRRLGREQNVTVLAVLHDLNLALEFCDALVLLDEGRLVKTGVPEEVLDPATVRDVYGLEVHRAESPWSGKPYLIPRTGDLP